LIDRFIVLQFKLREREERERSGNKETRIKEKDKERWGKVNSSNVGPDAWDTSAK
jgi:hypothetical protein